MDFGVDKRRELRYTALVSTGNRDFERKETRCIMKFAQTNNMMMAMMMYMPGCMCMFRRAQKYDSSCVRFQ